MAVVESFLIHRDRWIETLGDCVSHLNKQADVRQGHLGLLGFSMGGHLALRLAQQTSPPAIKLKAVVEFFAPVTQWPFNDPGSHLDRLPPLQIHHGDADGIVPIDQSRQLQALLVAAGKTAGRDFEFHSYPNEEHGFKSFDVINDSTSRTIAFFNQHL